ncbi:MAG: GTP-binding protein [Candidatus Helarchaeota archaeon]
MSEYDYLFKIIVVGDGAVGKTAITIRFAEGRFEDHYKMTIGVDFAIKLVEVGGYKIKMQVWDTGGQERFSYIRPLYYKGAMAALAIFDLTNRESYDNLPKWFSEVAENCGGIPLILVGNKADLPDRAVATSEAQALAEQMGIYFYEASAKNGKNIHDLFTKLAEVLLEKKIGIKVQAQAETSAPPTVPSLTPPPVAAPSSPSPSLPTPSMSAPPSPPKIPSFTAPPPVQAKPIPPQISSLGSSLPPSAPPPAPPPAVRTPPPQPMEVPSSSPTPTLDEALEILRGPGDELEPSTAPATSPPSAPPSFPEHPTLPSSAGSAPTPAPLEPIKIEPVTPEPAPSPSLKASELQFPPAPEMPEAPSGPVPFTAEQPAAPAFELETPPSQPNLFEQISAVESSEKIEAQDGQDSEFVPFIAGPIEQPKPIIVDDDVPTWMTFLKRKDDEEEEYKPSFIPFLVSDAGISSKGEEAEEIVLEVIPKEEAPTVATNEERICPNCHQKIAGAWKFCTYCGSKID